MRLLTIDILKKAKKEVIMKVITSFFIQGLLLVLPVYWSKIINHLSNNTYQKAYHLIIVSLVLSLLYYFWLYLNQKAWYRLYNKLYLQYTTVATSNVNNISKLNPGEYTNILNNDIDIICTFFGNLITRIIQVIEFLIIYSYFFSLNIYIFLITLLVSLLMLTLLFMSGKKIQHSNNERKASLDDKTIMAHNVYDSIEGKKSVIEKTISLFNQSTISYLKDNYNYNVLTLSIIYIVLGIIEITRWGLIFYGIYLVSIGNMEIGTILLVYTYYSKILTNFEVLGTISADYQSFIVSIKRLNIIGNLPKKKQAK